MLRALASSRGFKSRLLRWAIRYSNEIITGKLLSGSLLSEGARWADELTDWTSGYAIRVMQQQ